MQTVLLIAGLVACLIIGFVPMPSLATIQGWFTRSSAKPDRDAAVKAYDALDVYLASGPPEVQAALQTIWVQLGRKP